MNNRNLWHEWFLLFYTKTYKLYNIIAGDGDQLVKAVEILNEIKEVGIQPNTVTYSILLVACERYINDIF